MTKAEMIHRWFENLWNRGIEDTIDEMMAPDVIVHGLGDGPVIGTAQFHDFYKSFRGAFPKVNVQITNLWESGDAVIIRARVEVTKGPSGTPVSFEGAGISRVKNDRFIESWNHFDFLKLLTDMNVVPANAMATALAP
jgi:hypothetical protein